MSIWGFLVFRIWYLDFVKAILICLIYGNPDRVWSCLREARGDQDGMVGCQSLSSSTLVPPLLVAPMINDRTHQCFHIISDQTRNLNSSPKHVHPRLFIFYGKLKEKLGSKLTNPTLCSWVMKEFYDAMIIERKARKLKSTGISWYLV